MTLRNFDSSLSNDSRNTPLTLSVKQGSDGTVHALLEGGADARQHDSENGSPIFHELALSWGSESGLAEAALAICQMLIKDVPIFNQRSPDVMPPAMFAFQVYFLEFIHFV